MSWCLDCHRQPEKYVRPKSKYLIRMTYEAPANQVELGQKLVKEYKIQQFDELFDVPSVNGEERMKTMSSDLNPKVAAGDGPGCGAREAGAEDGKRFWQSLEELSETKEYREFLENEFPARSGERSAAGSNRRDVLKLMAASAALAGLSACTKLPTQKIVPYVKAPEEIVPGQAAVLRDVDAAWQGSLRALLVESHMGRPTKIEGNPEHPGSLGGTDVFAQASILGLYDPDRSQTVVLRRAHQQLGRFSDGDGERERGDVAPKGAGLRILTDTVTSPTLGAQIGALLEKYPAGEMAPVRAVRAATTSREGARWRSASR